ncbi:serine protease [bacterium]|nr:serine protease [bacterium]
MLGRQSKRYWQCGCTVAFFVATAFVAAAQESECEQAANSDIRFEFDASGTIQLILADGVYSCRDIDLFAFKQTFFKNKKTEPFRELLNDPGFVAMLPVTEASGPVQTLAHSVGRLAIKFRERRSDGVEPTEFVSWCTATHIGNGRLITAHHCVPGPSPNTLDVVELRIRFNYLELNSHESFVLPVDPNPIYSDPLLDFAVLEITNFAASQHSIASLDITTVTQLPAPQKLLVLHHPLAQPMRVSVEGCEPNSTQGVSPNGRFLYHNCATFPISSGAMVFDRQSLSPVAIHHSGVTATDFWMPRPAEFNYNTASLLSPIVQVLSQTGNLEQQPNTVAPDEPSKVFSDVITLTNAASYQPFVIGNGELGLTLAGQPSSNDSAYITNANQGSKLTYARFRSDIDQFCSTNRFQVTNWFTDLNVGDFAIVRGDNGQTAIIKLLDAALKDRGAEQDLLSLEYWIAPAETYNFSSDAIKCNETAFDLAKFGEVHTDENSIKQTVFYDLENYFDGKLKIGFNHVQITLRFSSRSADSVYFLRPRDYDPDRELIQSVVMPSDEFRHQLETVEPSSEWWLQSRVDPTLPTGWRAESQELAEGETFVEKLGDSFWAVSMDRVLSRNRGDPIDGVVFNYWEFESSVRSSLDTSNAFENCADIDLVNLNCSAATSEAGYYRE